MDEKYDCDDFGADKHHFFTVHNILEFHMGVVETLYVDINWFRILSINKMGMVHVLGKAIGS